MSKRKPKSAFKIIHEDSILTPKEGLKAAQKATEDQRKIISKEKTKEQLEIDVIEGLIENGFEEQTAEEAYRIMEPIFEYYHKGFLCEKCEPNMYCQAIVNKEKTKERWEDVFGKQFPYIDGNSTFGELDDVKDFIKTLLATESRCKKLVENGKAVCGVKLDCHLHDWRQKEMIATEMVRILEEYTDFLCKNHYVDDDVWAEEPKAIDRFISLINQEK